MPRVQLNRTLDIGGRSIGSNHPCFIIAEAGVNHNGDLELARALVDAAADAGADAVKFQTFKAESLVTADAPKAEYQFQPDCAAETQQEMLRRLELPLDAHRELMERATRRGMIFLSTPFDDESADFLEDLGVAAFKIASAEITNVQFLDHVARKHKPIILSTGMSTLDEVSDAVGVIAQAGTHDLALLHCVSNYPADPKDVNLRAIDLMANTFEIPVGFSDHTEGIAVAIGAAALGATVIEKHLTLDRMLPGPDHRASIEPDDLALMVQGIRRVQIALGRARKEPAASEALIASVARRSLVAARDLKAGSKLLEDCIAVRRPGTGLPPVMKSELIGCTLRVDVAEGTILSLGMLA